MIEKLAELERAATPGPWSTGTSPGTVDGLWSETPTGYDQEEHELTYLVAWCHSDARDEADAALIAASRNALPALLEVARAADTLVFDATHEDERGPAEEVLRRALEAFERIEG